MKIRLGFVSNSSSSSFTCDFCDSTESGWDMGLAEFDMVECSFGHLFCEGHCEIGLDNPKAVYAFLEKNPECRDLDKDDMKSEMRENFPSQFCPLCQLEGISTHDVIQYYKLRFGLNQDEVIQDIKDTFGTYEAFVQACVSGLHRYVS